MGSKSDKRKISVCIPYYNRADMVMDTIMAIYHDDRVSEIILCDDCSPKEDYARLRRNIKGLTKVKLYKNVENMHVQHNKRNALSFASNDWVILVDNDNVISIKYIDNLFAYSKWEKHLIYHPSFAAPNFSYNAYENKILSVNNLEEFASDNIIVTLLNTNNYFVNRQEYLKVYKYDKECRGADGIYNAYNWFKAQNGILIVPNHPYEHRVHESSAFLAESESNMKLIYFWLNEIVELSKEYRGVNKNNKRLW